jgi:ADP-ribosyl-[dinitrogen reductase] hydrolase
VCFVADAVESRTAVERVDRIAGVILGTAVGDALGLPREGLSRRRARRIFGDPPLRHRFLFGRGLVSDDTEHTCMLGQALLRGPDDADRFVRSLAWRLRFWLLGLPAGVGRATLQAILKLWLGFSPAHSGVWSAGNGPAMRSALLGVCLGNDRERLRSYVRASTRLTHTDPRAERGAFLIALAAHHGVIFGPQGVQGNSFFREARTALPDADEELQTLLDRLEKSLGDQVPAVELADALGLHRGISGYIYHTVPLVLYCWLRHLGDFRQAVEEIISLGGDADSTGAILGGLAGATLGASGIPDKWLAGLLEWPCSLAWMRRLAERLVQRFPETGVPQRQEPPPLFWPGLLPRNLLFLMVVLVHGFRRLLPPY